MIQKRTIFSHVNSVLEYKPNVPFITRPATWGIKTIKGVVYYMGLEGRLFEKKAFDKMFKPIVIDRKVKPKHSKRDLIGNSLTILE